MLGLYDPPARVARFLTSLGVERTEEGGPWRLTRGLVYESKIADRVIIVPCGFITDFASVPRLPFVYWLCGGVADEAAVVHDWLYSTGATSRKMADDVLAEACEALGLKGWKWAKGARRSAMWAAVRLFGGRRYTPAADPAKAA